MAHRQTYNLTASMRRLLLSALFLRSILILVLKVEAQFPLDLYESYPVHVSLPEFCELCL